MSLRIGFAELRREPTTASGLMQPGIGPALVISTTKFRQPTSWRYESPDVAGWNPGHSTMRSGAAGRGVQNKGCGRVRSSDGVTGSCH